MTTSASATTYPDRLESAWIPASGDCTAAKSVATLGGPAPYWTDWTFDVSGNRATQTAYDTAYTGSARPHALTGTSTADSAGTRTASYATDQDGDVTSLPSPAGTGNQTLTWNPEGPRLDHRRRHGRELPLRRRRQPADRA